MNETEANRRWLISGRLRGKAEPPKAAVQDETETLLYHQQQFESELRQRLLEVTRA